ncbi:hypothetical protein [Bradyrhizobium sp. 2TAF24]|uniref:hypothetical protein n=1 Tax=Bradyrhizobium sp. 2TAF24 TaxID=3233011 RepID=UPI003F8E85B3
MGIDRHEWEHRNYKSGRALKAAPPPELEGDPAAHDASLGDAEGAPQAAASDKAKAKANDTAAVAAPKPAARGKAAAKKAARAG